jgi:exosortase/archaeosortase family protein
MICPGVLGLFCHRSGSPLPAANTAAPRPRARLSVGRYVGTFLVVFIALQVAFQLTIYICDSAFQGYLHGYAEASGWLLRDLGLDVHVQGTTLQSARTAVDVRRGCDAFQPVALLCAGVVAFSGTAWSKLLGLTVGSLLIVVTNVLRITSLYWLSYAHPSWFAAWHEVLWPIFFIVLSLGIWILWAKWSASR